MSFVYFCKTRQKYWWRKWFGSASFIRNRNRDDLQLCGKTSDMNMYEREINSKRQRRAHDQSTVKKRTIQICIALESSDKHEIWVSDALRGEISRTRGEYVRLYVHIPLSLSQRLSLVLSCIKQAWWTKIWHPKISVAHTSVSHQSQCSVFA